MKFYKMYLILFGFIILKFQISLSDPQFPPHIDLQKVGLARFNNEKYNILKPTTHVVTDLFKDYMLRQGSTNTGERVFIDNNGLRHRWSGFLNEIQSLRKTDLKHVSGSSEAIAERTLSDVISNDNTTIVENSTNDGENVTQKEENLNKNQEEGNNDLENNETAQNSTKVATETLKTESKETTIKRDQLIHGAPATIKERLRQAKKQPNKPPVPTTKVRTVATTTFFCPFLGVITMSAFID